MKISCQRSELLYCESWDQALISILCRSTDQFDSSSISCGGHTLQGRLKDQTFILKFASARIMGYQDPAFKIYNTPHINFFCFYTQPFAALK